MTRYKMTRYKMTSFLDYIYYFIRNKIYYRKNRAVRIDFIRYENNISSQRENLTNAILYPVGLRVVHDEANELPKYMPLSKIQKEMISKASEFGYKIGLSSIRRW